MRMAKGVPPRASWCAHRTPSFDRRKEEVEVKRTLIVKILALLLTLGLATSAAAANPRVDVGGGMGGGLSGAGTGNY